MIAVDEGHHQTATAFLIRNALTSIAAPWALHATLVQLVTMGRRRLVAVLGKATTFATLVIALGNGPHGPLVPHIVVVAPDTAFTSTAIMQAAAVAVVLITTVRRKPKLATRMGALLTVKVSGVDTVRAPQLVDQAHKRGRSPCPYQQHTTVLSVRPKAVKLKAKLVISRIAALNMLV